MFAIFLVSNVKIMFLINLGLGVEGTLTWFILEIVINDKKIIFQPIEIEFVYIKLAIEKKGVSHNFPIIYVAQVC